MEHERAQKASPSNPAVSGNLPGPFLAKHPTPLPAPPLRALPQLCPLFSAASPLGEETAAGGRRCFPERRQAQPGPRRVLHAAGGRSSRCERPRPGGQVRRTAPALQRAGGERRRPAPPAWDRGLPVRPGRRSAVVRGPAEAGAGCPLPPRPPAHCGGGCQAPAPTSQCCAVSPRHGGWGAPRCAQR